MYTLYMARSNPQGILNYLNSWETWIQIFVQMIIVMAVSLFLIPASIRLWNNKGTWFGVFTPALGGLVASIILWDFPSLIAMAHGN